MDFVKVFRNSSQLLLDLVFPKFCVSCNKEGEFICKSCLEKVLLVESQVCPDCGKISAKGRYCLKHRRHHKLSGIIVSAYYEEGPIKEAIHNLKYNNIKELAAYLAGLMVKAYKKNSPFISDIILTATPMHYWRKAQRGYNQAEVLAEIVNGKLKLQKNYKIIKKIRKTKSQVMFSGKKRRENLKNAFKFINKNAIAGHNILIIDDVTTTGATLEECAKVLRAAGAKKVWGLVVARG